MSVLLSQEKLQAATFKIKRVLDPAKYCCLCHSIFLTEQVIFYDLKG